MKAKRDVLQDQLREYEEQVRGLRSYIRELTDQAAKHGTEKSEYETAVIEAEHNVKFYEDEIAHIKAEMGSGRGGGRHTHAGTILPRTARQGIGSFVFTAIGFVTGVFLGSQLKSAGKERREGGGEGSTPPAAPHV
jgi:hypothetical protein